MSSGFILVAVRALAAGGCVLVMAAGVGCANGASERSDGVAPAALRLSERALTRLGLTRELPDAVRDACALAARESTLDVHCPPVVPAGPTKLNFALRMSRSWPASYVMDLDSSRLDYVGSDGNGGHWIVAGGSGEMIDGMLKGREGSFAPLRIERVTLGGRRVTLLQIRGWLAGGGYNAAHAVARWRQGRVAYLVSIHGHRYQRQVEVMAEALIESIDAALDGA